MTRRSPHEREGRAPRDDQRPVMMHKCTNRRPAPRALRRAALALITLAVLTGCGSDPAPSATATTVPVPGAAATVTIPGDWRSTVQGGAHDAAVQKLVAHAPKQTGDSGFRTNIVVTATPATATLDEEGLAALAAADALPGWTPTDGSSGPIQVAGLPAFRIVGTYDASGVTATQMETIVELSAKDPRTFVYLTSSVAAVGAGASDAEAQAQANAAAAAQSVVDSVTPTP